MGWEHIVNIKGDKGAKGDKGDQGLPGVNAVENDTAVANYVTSGSTQTGGAVQARIDTSLAGFVPRQSPLLGFHGAIGNRFNSPVDILVLGDSITEEYGATAAGDGFIQRMGQRLRSMFPTSAALSGMGSTFSNEGCGYGYISANPGGSLKTYLEAQGWLSRSGNFAAASSTGGWALSGLILGPSTGSGNGKVTFKFTGTSIDLLLYQRTVNTNQATITIDGGTPIVYTVPNGSGVTLWQSGSLGGDGNHTIVVEATSNQVWLGGFYVRRFDEQRGIRIMNGGKSGSKAGDFSAAGGGSNGWMKAWDAVAPDLVMLAWGTNDVADVSASTFQANVQAVVDQIRAKDATVPIVFLMMFERSGFSGSWPAFKAAMKAVQAGTGYSRFIDIGDRFPAAGGSAVYGLMSDTLHPSSRGHGLIGEWLAQQIAPLP